MQCYHDSLYKGKLSEEMGLTLSWDMLFGKSNTWSVFVCLCFKFFFKFIFEREQEDGEGRRGRERESQQAQTVNTEPHVGLELRNHEIMT